MLKRLERLVQRVVRPFPRLYAILRWLKHFAKSMALPIQRGYVRYFPLALGKPFIFTRLIEPYLGQPTYRAIARTKAGVRMECSLPDMIPYRIYFFGVWEPHLTLFISQRLEAGDCFIDVGANIGYYTLLAASIVGETGNVCAIEASPSIFKRLQSNVALNSYSNIELFNVAASDKEGVLNIFLGPHDNLGLTTTDAKEAARHGNTLEAQIPALPLAVILGTERLLHAKLIKIDVEGAEIAVIRGIRHLMSSFSPQTEWVFELTPEAIRGQGNSAEEILGSFRDAGYTLYVIANDYSDFDYVSPPKSCQLIEMKELPDRQVDIVASKRKLSGV